jgi:hypothetical protein
MISVGRERWRDVGCVKNLESPNTKIPSPNLHRGNGCCSTALVLQEGLCVEKMRILILGDGNCSFGRALENRLEFSSLTYDLLNITTFDSQEQLLTKYPETRSILQNFRKNQKIQMKHSVDATKSLRFLLSQDILPSPPETHKTMGVLQDQQHQDRYDYVIFNFPHIGIENSQIHSSMIGHILCQVKEILNDNGVFYLSLADEQPKHWKLYRSTFSFFFYVLFFIFFSHFLLQR